MKIGLGRDMETTSLLAEFDLVIFDCDGVLIDSESVSCACLGELLRQHGLQVDLEDVFDRFLGRSFAVVEDHYKAAIGRPIDDGFAEALRLSLEAQFTDSLRPMPGIERVLSALPTRSCVASSSNRRRLSFSLALTGLASYFDQRVYSADQVANGKPSPDLFLYAAEQMATEPSRTLVIEDSVNGVRAARAAGMTVWGFIGGSHYANRDPSAMLIDAGANRILRTLDDLWTV